jgi:nucleoside-triphosphatase THEP1
MVPTSSEPHPPTHILLLTGVPGIGKTTIIKSVAKRFKGKRLSGFYTEEIREHGERRGFRLVIFEGQKRVIAHVDFPRAHCVGKYGVDVAALDEVVGPALVLDNAVAVYLVDEIRKDGVLISTLHRRHAGAAQKPDDPRCDRCPQRQRFYR